MLSKSKLFTNLIIIEIVLNKLKMRLFVLGISENIIIKQKLNCMKIYLTENVSDCFSYWL